MVLNPPLLLPPLLLSLPLSLGQEERKALEAENANLRRRLEEKTSAVIEEERKVTALTRKVGTVKAELESVRCVAGWRTGRPMRG